MTAPTTALSDLHAALAEVMTKALDAEQVRILANKAMLEAPLEELSEGVVDKISDILTLAPSARVDNSLLKTISSFLKDNGITSDLSDGDEMNETQAKLADLASRRRKVSLPTASMIN